MEDNPCIDPFVSDVPPPRNRRFTPSLMTQDLTGWARKHQTSLHPDVEIYLDPLTGLSFRATKDLPPASKIVNCSYQTTLSYLNAISASSFFHNHESVSFPPEFIAALKQDDPNIIGHFFLIQQFLMGEQSFWWHYIKLLPQPDEPEHFGIPIWWSETDRRFLNGTNAEPPIKIREEMWRTQWTKGIFLLRKRFENWEEYTYTLYQWAATIFGSRSFRASLTIPKEILGQSQGSVNDLSLTLDHVRKDRFSVLLPVTDIGNHNGTNQVNWLPDPIAGHFSLATRDVFTNGCQIFNYYGDKSNSELLVGYGFILLNPENDKVNLKLTPSPDAIRLRRSQSCHAIRDQTQPEQEFMFQVRMSIGKSGCQGMLSTFSEGLIDTLICMVANARERRFIEQNPGYCIEKASTPFGGPLSRAFIRALSILCEKLGYEMKRIETTASSLGEPRNQNQRLAINYRKGQFRVLREAFASVSEYLQQAISFNRFCPHAKTIFEANDRANFLSLECAFGWLQFYYGREFDAVMKIIAEDQEEPLPLNWAIIVEEWDNTYWIVWILLLWMLWDRGGDDFEIEHLNLFGWLQDWYGDFQKITKNDSELTRTLHADTSEQSTVDHMIQAILQLPDFEHLANGSLEVMEFRTEIRNYISHIVQEETVLLPYGMQHPPQKGAKVQQKMLYLNLTPLDYADFRRL